MPNSQNPPPRTEVATSQWFPENHSFYRLFTVVYICMGGSFLWFLLSPFVISLLNPSIVDIPEVQAASLVAQINRYRANGTSVEISWNVVHASETPLLLELPGSPGINSTCEPSVRLPQDERLDLAISCFKTEIPLAKAKRPRATLDYGPFTKHRASTLVRVVDARTNTFVPFSSVHAIPESPHLVPRIVRDMLASSAPYPYHMYMNISSPSGPDPYQTDPDAIKWRLLDFELARPISLRIALVSMFVVTWVAVLWFPVYIYRLFHHPGFQSFHTRSLLMPPAVFLMTASNQRVYWIFGELAPSAETLKMLDHYSTFPQALLLFITWCFIFVRLYVYGPRIPEEAPKATDMTEKDVKVDAADAV